MSNQSEKKPVINLAELLEKIKQETKNVISSCLIPSVSLLVYI